MKRAIILLNLGGPGSPEEVRPFLYRLFSDPEVIRIRFTPLRKFVAWLISTARAKKSRAMYAKMGGSSPIRRLTDDQALKLKESLHSQNKSAHVETAFTCSEPLVEDVVKRLSKDGVDTFLAFPLYPQYSFTTTKGALDRTRLAVKTYSPAARLIEIRSWPTHPLFLKAHAEQINAALTLFRGNDTSDVHLVFSAHSIPENLVTELGDPYKDEMEKSAAGAAAAAGWKGPWSLAWQSKLGPMKWLGPSTEETVLRLANEGVKRVLVVPIAFVTDHIETLVELDQELAETGKAAGIEEFHRTPGLNSHPTFIKALTEIALSQREFWAGDGQ